MEKSKLSLIASALVISGISGCKTHPPIYYDSPPIRRLETREGYCGLFNNSGYIINPNHFPSPSISARSYHKFRK